MLADKCSGSYGGEAVSFCEALHVGKGMLEGAVAINSYKRAGRPFAGDGLHPGFGNRSHAATIHRSRYYCQLSFGNFYSFRRLFCDIDIYNLCLQSRGCFICDGFADFCGSRGRREVYTIDFHSLLFLVS